MYNCRTWSSDGQPRDTEEAYDKMVPTPYRTNTNIAKRHGRRHRHDKKHYGGRLECRAVNGWGILDKNTVNSHKVWRARRHWLENMIVIMAQERAVSLLMHFFQLNDTKEQTILTNLDKK